MAKENCALCGKLVGGLNKSVLGDGSVICSECWMKSKPGIGVKPKSFTLESFQHHMETDLKVLAAKVKQERKEGIREINHAAKLEKLGLNLDRYDDAELRALNTQDVDQMAATLLGSKFYSFGSLLAGSPSEVFQTEMARVQVSQKMILIRQNEEIIRLLRQLVDAR